MNNQDSRLPDPFDSFVVGSLPRPKWVMEVVESRKRGEISDKIFQSILDSAVPFAITLQEKAGLNYITDGEWRRESYVKVFSDSVDGFKNDLIGVGTVNQDSHTTNMYPAVVNKIKQIKSIALNEAKFTMRHSFGGSKLLVTLPSAYTICATLVTFEYLVPLPLISLPKSHSTDFASIIPVALKVIFSPESTKAFPGAP